MNRSLPAILSLVALLATAHSSTAAETLDSLRQSVLAAEALFRNLELSLTSEYTAQPRQTLKGERHRAEILKDHWKSTSVIQDGMFKLTRSGEATGLGMPNLSRERIIAFDGLKTRNLERGRIANFAEGMKFFPHGNTPHSLLVNTLGIAPTLSTLLDPDSLEQYHHASSGDSVKVGLTLDPPREVSGHPCEIIHVRIGAASYELALASDRTYLPLACTALKPEIPNPQPFLTAATKSFKEISPGLWYPESLEVARYPQSDNTPPTQPAPPQSSPQPPTQPPPPQSVQTVAVTAISTNPTYPQSFFSDVVFPDSSEISIYKGDEIIARGKVGSPEFPPAMFSPNPPSNARNGWLNLLAILTLAAPFIILLLILNYRPSLPLRRKLPKDPHP